MEAVGSELNLFEPFMNQTAVVGEMVQEFARVATIIQGAPIEFQIEGSGKNYMELNNSKLSCPSSSLLDWVETSEQGLR